MSTDTRHLDPSELAAQAAWLRRLARTLLGDAAAADDIAQDAWLEALRRPPPTGPARPWLAVVLRNLARMRARGQRRSFDRERRLAEITDEAVPTAEQLLARHETQRLLSELVAALEEPFRSTVLLRYSEGMSAAQIARRQGVPAGTVRWRLKRALDDLRQGLERRYAGDRRAWAVALAPLAARGTVGPWAAGLLIKAAPKLAAVAVLVLVGFLALLIGKGFGPGGGDGVATGADAGVPPATAVLPGTEELLRWSWDRGAAEGGIEGTVRDPSGQAVEGAVVVVMVARRGQGPFPPGKTMPRPVAVVTSRAHGRYHVPGVRPGVYTLTASAQGHAAASRDAVAVAPGARVQGVDITLGEGGASLSGQVLDTGGGPVPGARILALALDDVSVLNRSYAFEKAAAAVADAQGRYRLAVKKGWYWLRAEADGYAPEEIDAVLLQVEKRQAFRLHAAARIVGRVVARDTGAPIAAAEVRALSAEPYARQLRDTISDQDGQFAFADLAPGSYRLEARKGPLVGQHAPVPVSLGQTSAALEIPLDRGRTVRGRVRGARGEPVAAAVIVARPELRFVFAASDHGALSGADGTFAVEGLLPGKFMLEARAPGHAPTRRRVAVGATDIEGVDLSLTAEATLEGRVVDGAGRGVADAQVVAWVKTSSPFTDFAQTGRSVAEGKFRIERLPAGELQLRVVHAAGVATFGPQPIARGEAKRVTLTLEDGVHLSGKVTYDDDEPAAGAEVRALLRLTGIELPPTRTDAEGGFTLGPLLPGELVLKAVAPGQTAVFLPPAPERKDQLLMKVSGGERRDGVRLVVPRPARTIAGRTLDPDGRPVAGAVVAAGVEQWGSSLGVRYQKIISDAEGRFVIEAVSPGRYTLWASHAEFPTAEARGVQAGATDVVLAFAREALLAGVVTNPDGRPAVDYTIVAVPAARADETIEQRDERLYGVGGHRMPVHDQAGAFSFRRLPAGAYELTATTPDGRSGRLPAIGVRPGERRTNLRLALGAGATLTGRVIDAEAGQPVPSALIEGRGAGLDLQTTADEHGGFELPGAPTGQDVELEITAHHVAYVREDMEVTVPAAGGRVDLGAVKLQPGFMDWLRPDVGRTGLRPVRRNGRVIAGALRPGHPAERAGIRRGDVILSIGGRDVREAGASTVDFLLFGKTGDPVELVVESAGAAPRAVSFTRVAPTQ